MKILIDIGHPSHVHYFRNLIRIMQGAGHEFFITARDKEIAQNLLSAYGIEYTSRGSGKSGLWGKIIYTLKTDKSLFRFAKKINPDLMLSCSSPYLAHTAFLLRRPHICIDDTDISDYEHLMYVPFSDCIISPIGFKKNFGEKHIFIDSTFDLFYLHHRFFKPNPLVREELRLDNSRKTIFFRFTSLAASHDWGNRKISVKDKLFIINTLKEKYNIIISSEIDLPENLSQYKVNVSPHKVHDVLYYSDLFIGESGSMSTESVILGTPAINLAEVALGVGIFERLINLGLYKIIPDIQNAIEIGEEMLLDSIYQESFNTKRKLFLDATINPTDFLVWFVDNYPESKKIMQRDSNYQYKFK
jgi:uncharacterized protein